MPRVWSAKPQWETLQTTRRAYTRPMVHEGGRLVQEQGDGVELR
jgi:hypothetical protein